VGTHYFRLNVKPHDQILYAVVNNLQSKMYYQLIFFYS